MVTVTRASRMVSMAWTNPRRIAFIGVLLLAFVVLREEWNKIDVVDKEEDDAAAVKVIGNNDDMNADALLGGGGGGDEEDDVTVAQAAFLQMMVSPSSSQEEEKIENDSDEITPHPPTTRIYINSPPHWYRPNVKYFIYQPSGGLSNQRKILEWALRVCQVLERTCIIPPIGPHTTFYYKYNAVPYSDCSPADAFLEAESLRRIAPVEFLTSSLMDFTQAHEGRLGGSWRVVERNKLKEKRDSPWSSQDLSEQFGDEAAQFLYFAKGTMWQCFNFTTNEISLVQRYVRFHPEMRLAARVLSQHLGKYNALHIRFSDGESNKVRTGWLKPSSTFIIRMRMAKFPEYSNTLYIATVPSKQGHPYFNKFKSAYNVTFSSSLENLSVVKKIVDQFPTPMKSIALGVIEQHVCTRANKFLGTGFSTFSEHIREMRRMREVAHDPWALSTKAPKDVQSAEMLFMSEQTPCLRETKPC